MSSRIPRIFRRRNKVKGPALPPNVDLDRGFIFVHIPKTAGTSIYSALGMDKSHHHFLSYYKDCLEADVFRRLKKFAFVRDPLGRFVSLYNYSRLDVSYFHNNISPEDSMYGAHKDYKLLKNASLSDAAKYLFEGRLIHNAPDCVWLPQSRWIETNEGLADIDVIGRFESLQSDFLSICSALNLPELGGAMLETVNPSKKLSSEVDDDVVDIVRSYYEEDYKNFGYSV